MKCIICLETKEQLENSYDLKGITKPVLNKGTLTKEIVMEEHENIPVGDYYFCWSCEGTEGDTDIKMFPYVDLSHLPQPRDIIEFHCITGKSTFVDRVNEVCVYSCGKIQVWTDLYPEFGNGPFLTDKLVRIVEASGKKYVECPPFPYKVDDKIKYEWNGTKPIEGTIKQIWWSLSDTEAAWRCVTDKDHYVFDDDVRGLVGE